VARVRFEIALILGARVAVVALGRVSTTVSDVCVHALTIHTLIGGARVIVVAL
jgi:hypothetical protein